MTHITEHDTEEEWESRNCQRGWVSLLVLWNTICINNHLEALRGLVRLNIGRSCNCVVIVSNHSHSWENRDFAHYLMLLLGRCPEVPNECCVLHLHHIECLIHGFLFCEEHFVDINGRDLIILLIVGVKLVEDHELLGERVLGLMIHVSRVINALSDFVDLPIDLVHLRNLIPISMERVADTQDFISNELTVPVHDDVD